jgi:hypothetical protein
MLYDMVFILVCVAVLTNYVLPLLVALILPPHVLPSLLVVVTVWVHQLTVPTVLKLAIQKLLSIICRLFARRLTDIILPQIM